MSKIILPSITLCNANLGYTNKEGFYSLESLHCRAMPCTDVLQQAKWDPLIQMYKIRLAHLAYKLYNNIIPISMSHIITKSKNK